MTTQTAIEQSIRENRIVHLEWSQKAENALMASCDDSADCFDALEFWGTDEDGDEWRVHLDRT